MLRSKLEQIIKEEIEKYLKEMNSLDRAINRLKRGGTADREEDQAAARFHASNEKERARQAAKAGRPKYKGFYEHGNIIWYKFVKNGKVLSIADDELNKYPDLAKLIPKKDRRGGSNTSYKPRQTTTADDSFDAYVDGILDKVGPKGPRGA